MKKFLGIVFIGLLWCNVGFAEKWTKYTQSKSLTIYYDRQSLNKTDLYSYINLLFDLKESNVTSKGTLRSYKVYRQFNCTDNKSKEPFALLPLPSTEEIIRTSLSLNNSL